MWFEVKVNPIFTFINDGFCHCISIFLLIPQTVNASFCVLTSKQIMLMKCCLQLHTNMRIFISPHHNLVSIMFHFRPWYFCSFVTVEDFQKLQEAKEVLCNETKRNNYDLWKRSGVTIPFHDWQALNDSVKSVCYIFTLYFSKHCVICLI